MIRVRKVIKSKFLDTEDSIKMRIKILKQGFRFVREFAEAIGISESYMSLILAGKRNLSQELIAKFRTAGIAIR